MLEQPPLPSQHMASIPLATTTSTSNLGGSAVVAVAVILRRIISAVLTRNRGM